MESESPSTAIILVNELHFLALEEKLRLFKNPESLDILPITRLVGNAEKSDVPIEPIETMPWEQAEARKVEKVKYDYYFLNPDHDDFNLQFADERYRYWGYRTCCIKHLQLRMDIYPKSDEIYELTFKNRFLPQNSATRKQALDIIDRYNKEYYLYRPIKEGDEEQTRLWLGRLHCLELKTIRKASKKASNAEWKKAYDVTSKYLVNYRNKENYEDGYRSQNTFFGSIETLTGSIIAEAHKIYDDTKRGWVLDGLVRPRRS